MEIQWSLVLFTALSGAGAWLVACAGLDAFKGLARKAVVPAVIAGISLIIVGGMKKTEGALSLAIVAVVGAFIGAVAYRVLMWTASIALMSLFGVSI